MPLRALTLAQTNSLCYKDVNLFLGFTRVYTDRSWTSLYEGYCMKTTGLFVFAISVFLLLNASVSRFSPKHRQLQKFCSPPHEMAITKSYIMNPDGSEQVNLTKHRANDLDAVWSPTGDQILFVSDRDGVRDLYLMESDRGKVRRVFKKEAYREDPTWSPDGKQIAYTSADEIGAGSFIYIATLGEQEEELLVRGFYPAWSPDRTEIAYVTYTPIGHTRRVTLIDIRTRKQKRLLPKEAMDWQNGPSWLPTADKLIFSWNKTSITAGSQPAG